MPVTVRLHRQGAKKNPQFLIVAVDAAKKRDGAYLENLGHYYPKVKNPLEKIKANLPAILAWKAKGAQFSQTAEQLLKLLQKQTSTPVAAS